MKKPTAIRDLRKKDFVLIVEKEKDVKSTAERFMKRVFDEQKAVTLRHLFNEDGLQVYQVSSDNTGDNLYIIYG